VGLDLNGHQQLFSNAFISNSSDFLFDSGASTIMQKVKDAFIYDSIVNEWTVLNDMTLFSVKLLHEGSSFSFSGTTSDMDPGLEIHEPATALLVAIALIGFASSRRTN